MTTSFTQETVAAERLETTRRIYEEDPENDPYDGGNVSTLGYTVAASMELASGFHIPVHVLWGRSNTDSFVPTRSQYETMALYIWWESFIHSWRCGCQAGHCSRDNQLSKHHFPHHHRPHLQTHFKGGTLCRVGTVHAHDTRALLQQAYTYHKRIFAQARVCTRSKTFQSWPEQCINME